MTNPDLLDIPLQSLDGTPTRLATWKGRVLLVVNVASKCGLTPQYTALQALHQRFEPRGLTVLGVPCNDFAGQEPGEAADIRGFCDTNYQVTFPLLAKLRINSSPRHPLYTALIAAQPQALPSGDPTLRDTLSRHGLLSAGEGDVLWNFEKFLIGRDGRVVGRFAPDIAPDDERLVAAIEDALG